MPQRSINVGTSVMILIRFLALIVLFASLSTAAEAADRAKRITVVFRCDDPSALTSREMESKLIEAFRRYNMCCTFAVVPFACIGDVHDDAPQSSLPLPPEKAEMFRKASREGVLEIAQHGYSHQTNGLPGQEYSEFSGLGYEEQLQKIERGRQFLETELGLPVTIFVPPWNTYDRSTLRALEKAGFRCLSADAGGVADASCSLQFLPATAEITELKNAVTSARDSLDPSPVIVVLFHEYGFREVDLLRGQITYDEFVHVLAWLSQQQDVKVEPMRRVQNLGRERFIANKGLRTFLPASLQVYPRVYLSLERVQKARLERCVLLTLFYGGVVSVAGILGFLASVVVFARVTVMISRLALLAGLLSLLGGSVWTFHDGHFGAKGLMAIVGVLGCCMGSSVAGLLRHRRVRSPQHLSGEINTKGNHRSVRPDKSVVISIRDPTEPLRGERA